MSLSVFNDLCLICTNYHCQNESYHYKHTLNSIQKLLASFYHLEVSTKKNAYIFGNLKTDQNDFKYEQNLVSQEEKVDKNLQNKDEKQSFNFIAEIQDLLETSKYIENKILAKFLQTIKASLSFIYLFEYEKSDPLFFHDISEVVTMIVFYKYKKTDSKKNTPKNLNFTQGRIKRAIRKLIKTMEKLQERLNMTFQNKAIMSQKINGKQKISRIAFKDLTNELFQKNFQVQKLIANSKITQIENVLNQFDKKQTKRVSFDQEKNKILSKNGVQISLRNLVEELRIILGQKTVNEQLQQYFLHRLLSHVNLIRLNLIEYQEKNESIQKISPRTILEPADGRQPNPTFFEKASTINQNDVGKNKVMKFFQEAQTIQYTFIEGLPFPKSRKSIDFSVLQITDQILLSYIPSLQKLKDLEQLCLRKNNLSQLGYKVLKNTFPTLKSLDLRQTLINTELCQLITQFKSLNILYISQCHIQSKSLVQICIKLQNLNVLYCDNIVLIDNHNRSISLFSQDSDMRGIFYIMVLNLRKLIYLSIKGFFDAKVLDQMFRTDPNQTFHPKQIQNTKQLHVFKNIYDTLQRRNGILQI